MKERQKATDLQQAHYAELHRTQSKAIWRMRLKIFRDVFPWITEEIKAFAGLAKNDPLESQESQLKFIASHGDYMNGTMASDPRLADLHRRQNEEWIALTGLPPLGHHTEWRAAALASGANVGESLSLADYNRVAESIKSWAIARRAGEMEPRHVVADRKAKAGTNRGRRKTRDLEADRQLWQDWENAKAAKIDKATFAKERGVTIADIDNAMRNARR